MPLLLEILHETDWPGSTAFSAGAGPPGPQYMYKSCCAPSSCGGADACSSAQRYGHTVIQANSPPEVGASIPNNFTPYLAAGEIKWDYPSIYIIGGFNDVATVTLTYEAYSKRVCSLPWTASSYVCSGVNDAKSTYTKSVVSNKIGLYNLIDKCDGNSPQMKYCGYFSLPLNTPETPHTAGRANHGSVYVPPTASGGGAHGKIYIVGGVFSDPNNYYGDATAAASPRQALQQALVPQYGVQYTTILESMSIFDIATGEIDTDRTGMAPPLNGGRCAFGLVYYNNYIYALGGSIETAACGGSRRGGGWLPHRNASKTTATVEYINLPLTAHTTKWTPCPTVPSFPENDYGVAPLQALSAVMSGSVIYIFWWGGHEAEGPNRKFDS